MDNPAAQSQPIAIPVRDAADRPYVFLNLAMTVDGKIAPASRKFEPFTSPADREGMLELRSHADAVMSGARTVNSGPFDLGPGGPVYRRQRKERGLAECNLRVVVSGSAAVDPHARVFREKFSPVLVLVSGSAPAERRRALEEAGALLHISGDRRIDFPEALRWLRREHGVRRLLCEGGGEVNAGLFEAGLVDELFVTLAPVLFGGRDAPTIWDGAGVERLAGATRLRLVSVTPAGGELFLRYRVEHPGR